LLILARSTVIKVITAIKAIKAAKVAKVATATKVIKVIRGQAMYRNIVLPGVGCHSKKKSKTRVKSGVQFIVLKLRVLLQLRVPLMTSGTEEEIPCGSLVVLR
jgi:hypothetical protein